MWLCPPVVCGVLALKLVAGKEKEQVGVTACGEWPGSGLEVMYFLFAHIPLARMQSQHHT